MQLSRQIPHRQLDLSVMISFDCPGETGEMSVMTNKKPVWSVEGQSYVLNFHGRVTRVGMRNYILFELKCELTMLDYKNLEA